MIILSTNKIFSRDCCTAIRLNLSPIAHIRNGFTVTEPQAMLPVSPEHSNLTHRFQKKSTRFCLCGDRLFKNESIANRRMDNKMIANRRVDNNMFENRRVDNKINP